MKILFAGDFSVQDRSIELFHDIDKAVNTFGCIANICAQHDISIVNFESPVTDSTKGILKDGPCIRNPKNSIEVLKKTGFGLFTLANNHLKDFGSQGIFDTFRALDEQHIAFVGAGRNIVNARTPFVFDQNGTKVGFINICENESSIATDSEPGSCPISEINLFYDLHTLRSKVDYLVVIAHGGREHFQLPTPRMKKLYHYIIDLGADLVVNHHQHCFSGYEMYKGKHIFYGLGNFYFDNPKKRNSPWNKGLLLSVEFGEDINIDIMPFSQCDELPVIRMENYGSVEEEIKRLNGIIDDDVKLKQVYEGMIMNVPPLSPMQPYTSHYIRALYHRGLLPDFISRRKKAEILNIVRCETHRELLIAYLENLLSE